SSARIQRLAQTPDATPSPSCRATTQCARALQKAGADSSLLQSLAHQSLKQSLKQGPSGGSDRSLGQKSAVTADCGCTSPAAHVAALVHDENFNAAEDETRALLNNDASDASPPSRNNALL